MTEAEIELRFRRKERLKRADDIAKAFAQGKKSSCSGAKLFYIENGYGKNRIAFTFARKYGNAVRRNRSRRISREAYRHVKFHLRQGYDMVLLVYPNGDDYARRAGQLDSLFERAGLFQEVR